MLKLVGETRPLCKWPDHDWNMMHYVLIGDTLLRKYKCRKCGRFHFIEDRR